MSKILIFGAGYVGSATSISLAKKNEVTLYDVDKTKINSFNDLNYPLEDDDSENIDFTKISLKPVSNIKELKLNIYDFIILCVPTDFKNQSQSFDTSIIEEILLEYYDFFKKDAVIIIKSTLPIGFTNELNQRFGSKNIIFSPEFLREGSAINDADNPSRVIIGSNHDYISLKYKELVTKSIQNNNVEYIICNPNEAESIKLFSNTYLAMRVAFFNELDTYALENNISSDIIVNGVSSDPRIGKYHNNPSFGYGGYCLPKDSKQLESSYKNIPQTLISSTIQSNKIRKIFIADYVMRDNPKIIGIYRLTMKKNSHNCKDSAILDIIDYLINTYNVDINIYEPMIDDRATTKNCVYLDDLEIFKKKSEIILANRLSSDLDDCLNKVFSRDLFNIN